MTKSYHPRIGLVTGVTGDAARTPLPGSVCSRRGVAYCCHDDSASRDPPSSNLAMSIVDAMRRVGKLHVKLLITPCTCGDPHGSRRHAMSSASQICTQPYLWLGEHVRTADHKVERRVVARLVPQPWEPGWTGLHGAGWWAGAT
jgi:hypothetical protein